MMPLKFGFDHFAITVSNLQQSIRFYRDVLGFKVLGQLIQDNGNFIIVYLDMGNGCLLYTSGDYRE